jgi:endoglucanase
VATTAVSIGRFLHAYERDPVRHGFDDLGIPESGNGVPDLLDEMQVGLDWMLTMQRSDGAVYRKVGGEKWPPHVVPEQDAQPRYVYGVTSPETAKAAAAWALAARLYRARDPLVAARYLEAARLAWSWLEAQPAEAGQVFDWRDGDDAGSGPYKSNEVDTEASLTTDRDDRLWAATELLITTAEPRWRPLVQQLAADAPVNLYEWKDASLLALSYFLWHPALARERVLARQLGQRIVARAQAPLRQVQRGGYRIANPRFVWGSNKMTAEEGAILCLAHGVAPQRKLLAAARDQLHYLLGRNSFGTSFVSGFGERAVRHPTHLFSEAAKLELPGLFVGGPNDAEQSKIAPQHRGALSWIDDARSYATNEFAIDYNASLYGLLAELERGCAK